jgi:tRNA A-37 threonylcarbamoyl transferase component Bud32
MENHVDFELSGYRWKVKSEYAEDFRLRVAPLALSGEDAPELRVVSHKHARDSFIISASGTSPDVFVKVHRNYKPRDRFKALILPSRAKAEWLIGNSMLASGLPVAEPLGYGELRIGGVAAGCALIVRALTSHTRLSTYLYRHYYGKPNPVAVGERDEFLRALGALIRQMHDAGFRHPDLHPGNIMVDVGHESPEFRLVDLHSSKRYSLVSDRLRMADLAKMIFSLRGFLTESQLREILSEYRPEAGELQITTMLIRLFDAADTLKKKRVKSRAKRCLKTSGRFIVETVGDNKLYRWREFTTEAVLGCVERHKEICASGGPGIVKGSAKSALTVFEVSDGGESIYVKEFKNTGLIRLLETTFYTHRGKRAWKAGHLLYRLGVRSAGLIALVESKRSGFTIASYLIMREITDATRLNAYLLRRYFRMSGGLTSEEALEKRKLIRLGARALRDFHSKKIYHKDLSAKNLLVSYEEDGLPCFYCVDTDSVQFPPRLSLRRKIKNLSQLNGLPGCVTTADRVRFYKEYFGIEKLTPRHKRFIRTIRRLSQRRMEHSRRIDARVRANYPLDEHAYEDITSI